MAHASDDGILLRKNYETLNYVALVLVLVTLLSTITASAASKGQQAAVSLLNASATISQTSDTQWTPKKTGAVANAGTRAASTSDRGLDKVVGMSG